MTDDADGFERHVTACNNAVLPGGRLRLRLGGQPVGWVWPAVADAMAGVRRDGADVVLDDAAALPGLARRLAEAGMCRWRDEAFDVRAAPGGAVLSTVDRGALPVLGILAEGVHVNGLVERTDGAWLWVGRRAMDRPLDPGKLDHLVAGGIGAGQSPAEALVREAAEEAGMDAALAATAVPVGVIGYACERAEGLRRDWLHCYDLILPESFVPRPADHEAAGFELWTLARVAETVRTTDEFKFNVALVLIDLLIRRGVIAGDEARGLRGRLDQGQGSALDPQGDLSP